MGDRFASQVTIFSTPDHDATLATLHEHGFDVAEWYDGSERDSDGLLGVPFHDPESGSFFELTRELSEQGCAFEGQSEAKYEFDGYVSLNVPGVGSFESEAGQDGSVFVRAVAIDQIVDAWAAGQQDEIDNALNELTGRKVRDALDTLRKEIAG